MRVFFIVFFLTNSLCWAQLDTGTGVDGACDENTDYRPGGIFNCTSLIIDNPLALLPFNVGAAALVIKVQGAVTISSPLDLTGADGGVDLSTGIPSAGAAGAPGASDGGGSAAGTPQDAGTSAASDGKTATLNGIGACGGGGGGGFSVAGATGGTCGTPGFPGVGGSAFSSTTLFTSAGFRGGFGGGAGGEGPVNGEFGGGGGGGAGLRIIAGGEVTISAIIDAGGGDGGDDTGVTDGAGGGGGSGGVIWIQTNGNISLTAANLLRVNGGAAGVGITTLANGGVGSIGFIRLEDDDGSVANAPANSQVIAINPAPSLKLNSDISCGMISNKKNEHVTTMFIGFLIVMMIRILFQVRKKI